MTQNARPLLVIAGPTGVGKTACSLALARHIGGEIVSADSMQVYRGLNVGTAKLPVEERQGIPHHLIDCLEVSESFHVARFQEMAKTVMEEIYARGRIPMLVGGTGFYIQAVTHEIDFTGHGEDEALRRSLTDIAESEGDEALHRRLAEVDPASAREIHPRNRKRVIRALEYHAMTGERISEHNAREREKTSPYRLCTFALTDERARLYRQIDARVDEMVSSGLEEEARWLFSLALPSDLTAQKAIGYKEWFPYFAGTYSREEAIRLIKQNTRHYAKRQWTWFRMRPDVIWIDKRDYPETKAIVQKMLDELHKAGITGGEER